MIPPSTRALVLTLAMWLSTAAASGEVRIQEFLGYSLWMDCERNAPVFFLYELGPDTGNFDNHPDYENRVRNYTDAPGLEECQPDLGSDDDYVAVIAGVEHDYAPGHLVPLSHLDSDAEEMMETRFFANLLPQAPDMNTGAWRRTEVVAECRRETAALTIMGGPVWEGEHANAHFQETDGVATPASYWKAIIPAGGDPIAWTVPNTDAAEYSDLADYRLDSIREALAAGGFIPASVRSWLSATGLLDQTIPDDPWATCGPAIQS